MAADSQRNHGLRASALKGDSECGHHVPGAGERTLQQGLLASHVYRAGRYEGEDRDHHPAKETRFSGMQLIFRKGLGAGTGDGEHIAFLRD